MKIGGWHRLWLVLCAIYFLVVAVFSVLLFPKGSSVEESAIRAGMKSDSVAAFVSGSGARGITVHVEGRTIVFPSGTSQNVMENVANEYYEAMRGALRDARIRFMAGAFGVWVVPCIVIYLIGRSVRWVRDGFKNSTAV